MKNKGKIFGFIGIAMIVVGFVLFAVTGFTATIGRQGPNIALIIVSVVLFMGGGIVSSIGFAGAMKSRISKTFNNSAEDDSFLGKIIQTTKNKLEVENLEAKKEIQELEKQVNNRKCSNCGAVKEDALDKCPFCGS